MFFKIGAFKNFTIFAAKHLYLSLFYNKVVRLRPANLLKKKLWHRCFPVKKPERSGDTELGVLLVRRYKPQNLFKANNCYA